MNPITILRAYIAWAKAQPLDGLSKAIKEFDR